MVLFLSREILSITGITITENGEPDNGAQFEITVHPGYIQVIDPNFLIRRVSSFVLLG